VTIHVPDWLVYAALGAGGVIALAMIVVGVYALIVAVSFTRGMK